MTSELVTIALTLEYDGTAYQGWQIQDNGPTVQACLEESLLRLTHEPIRVRVAGRTDSGVHALGQVVSFTTASRIPPEKFAVALNHFLPSDISVRRSERAAPGFDARRDSVSKHYRYRIWNDQLRAPLVHRRAWHVKPELDVERMRAGAAPLVGEHDFESFRSVHCDAAHAIRRIDSIMVSVEARAGQGGRMLTIDVEGNAFCRNMVRIIAGTLTQIGRGRFEPEATADMLAARDRTKAGMTAPACGLYLVEVRY